VAYESRSRQTGFRHATGRRDQVGHGPKESGNLYRRHRPTNAAANRRRRITETAGGFSLLPAFDATPTVLPLGLIMLAGGISGKAKHARRARVALVIAIALVVLMTALEILRRASNATGG
jgi:hypothetical protein